MNPRSISLDAELWKRAKVEALKRGITVSKLLEDALKKSLDKNVL